MQKIIPFLVFTLVLSLLLSVSAFAGMGDEVCKPYKPLVVQVTTQFARGEDNGFGFIVGEADKKFYIVTARHVVQSQEPDNPAKKILLRFSWDPAGQAKTAELMDIQLENIDLALLRINKSAVDRADNITWGKQAWCRQWKQDEPAWFIGRSGKWYVPRDKRAGIMLRTEADMRGIVHVDIDKIKPGTSGAPLIINNGIVGMVLKDLGDEARALDIDFIRRFVSKENPYPWNLVQCVVTPVSIVEPKVEPKDEEQKDDPITKDVFNMQIVYVPGGCFQMGSNNDHHDEKPAHKVCVDGFWMGKYEVTQKEWREIMNHNPAGSKKGDKYPVEQVSWREVQSFIVKLNNKTGKQFRLPTEAEWEYAARGGTATVRYWGDDISCDKAMYGNDESSSADECVDYVKTRKGLHLDATAPVGSYPPNQAGLYDMIGNVWEWCADWYGVDYYGKSPQINPPGASTGQDRVMRGGSWRRSRVHSRAARRSGNSPSYRIDTIGFRLVLSGQ